MAPASIATTTFKIPTLAAFVLIAGIRAAKANPGPTEKEIALNILLI
jgi:hypothetical protein